MGRKPLEESSIDTQAMDLVVQKQEEEQLSIQQVEEDYGDGQPYERLRLENEIRFFQQQMADSLLETGKRLLRLKANEGHGGFLKCLENIEMSPRSAQYAMTAALKFSNTNTYSHLGQSKLKALSVLDDDSIQTLEDGGKVAGVTIDEIEKMTVRELKKTLREKDEKLREEKEKRDQDIKSREQVIDEKEQKINELDRLLRGQEPPTKEQIAQSALDTDINKPYFGELWAAIGSLQNARDLIARAQKIEGVNLIQLDTWVHRHDDAIKSLEANLKILQNMIDDIHVYEEGEDEEAEKDKSFEE